MSTRKSARIKAKSKGNDIPLGTSNVAALSEDELSSTTKTGKPRGRKRKSAVGSAALDQARPVKKTRTRGLLQRVLDMPFDLLPEIFGHLDPPDLLNLSRTSKDLRKFLMSRSARSIWLQSMNNAPEMVDCPNHISEPAWVNFLFGKGCTGCGKNNQIIHTLDLAFVRLCSKCLKESFTEIKDISTFAHSRAYPITVVVHNIVYSFNGVWYVEPGRDARWTKEYEELKTEEAKAEWERQITTQKEIELATATQCSHMRLTVQTRLDREKRALIDERRKQVVEHIRKMGWGQEIDNMGGDMKKHDVPFITAACQKNITPRILVNMEPRLQSTMESIKARRLADELRASQKQRMILFSLRTAEFAANLSSREPQPGIRDIFENQRAKDMVFKTPPEVQLKRDDFDFIEGLLPEIVEQWRTRAASQLIAKIRKTMGDEHIMDPSTVLSLATSSFSCNGGYSCSRQVFWFDDALAHPCCIPPCSIHDAGMETEPTHLYFTKQPWSANALCYNQVQHTIISNVVELCGLDPLTTTVDQMNQLDPVFECIKCRQPQYGRQVMNWQGVVQHVRYNHGFFTFDFDRRTGLMPLEGDEAEDAKKRIAEAREKRLYKEDPEMLCMHCPFSGKIASLRRHLMKHHNNFKPAEGVDFVLSGKNPNLYQSYPVEMWPPYVSPNDVSDSEDGDEDEDDGGCTCGQCYISDDEDEEDDGNDDDDESADFFY